ncbi:MAG: nitrile hydratase subunit beta [Pseudomonadota bacterium]|jgi:nitrile hydratase|uniref:nitrile hydratase subunit beta n=1 Tax=Aquabacterium parvum TaxID=70584 RepID=UPI000718C204|nr:nitrile hydratase subunit beta [Aquabacterium parvum]OGB04713.1 MAG: nitrile hydratase subunit beta [Burkholderiales bacterium RIFCSPHIGHO2_12_FULL_63_20]OGB66309.1 MAG: nitrile hydratase subunit beta [Burkholderiales bacterium RIFCSPLOWO2_12_FULL_64_99]
MNGIHDMGGLHGFGLVAREKDEPVFHSRWESRVFCMTQVLDTKQIWNLDEHRHEIELMPTADYLTAGYYGRWLFAMERLLARKDILGVQEVQQRVDELSEGAERLTPPAAGARAWPLSNDRKVRWGAWRHEETVTPRFSVGQIVRVRNLHPEGHTRVTAYARGKVGVVDRVNAEAWIFPDTRAHYRGEHPQPVYGVRIPATELWGPQAEANTNVFIDLSEDHLEPA